MMFGIVFWDVLPCNVIVDRRFRGAYCLLMMEAKHYLKMSHIVSNNHNLFGGFNEDYLKLDKYYVKQWLVQMQIIIKSFGVLQQTHVSILHVLVTNVSTTVIVFLYSTYSIPLRI
jgi:hypothetical protein